MMYFFRDAQHETPQRLRFSNVFRVGLIRKFHEPNIYLDFLESKQLLKCF